jgi:putative sugar O-methyltransferase
MKNSAQMSRIINRIGWSFLKSVGLKKKRMAQLLGRTRLNAEQINLLKEMREANSTSRSPFRASDIWIQLSKRFDDWFWWEGIEDVECQEMNSFFSSPRPGEYKLLRYACWMFYQTLKASDKFDLLSKIPATANPESGLAFEFEGHLVSWDLLISIDTMNSLIEADPAILTEPVIVVDLGAGWGRMGYALKKVNPNCTYVICDLPEALLVSSTYLPKLVPHEKFHYFSKNRSIREFNKETFKNGGVFFLGAQDLECFADNTVNFFISIASFQEMTPKQVNEYFDLIDRKVNGVFYTQQLFEAKTHTWQIGEISGYKEYPFRSNWKQIYLRSATFSDLYFETAHQVL